MALPSLRRPHEHVPEEATDAFLEGDVPFAPGTVRAALAHRSFRIVWTGALLSNVGTWMQNVVLTAFAFTLTRSPSFVGLVAFAQLGPTLVFASVGGVLADAVNRKRLLVWAQTEQMLLSFVLAWLARGAHPSKAAIVLCVLGVGAGQAFNGPAYSSLLPQMVGRRDLGGAVSLQSFQMNISRVVGPAIGGLLYPAFGPAGVFFVNALTYLFAIVAVLMVDIPGHEVPPEGRRVGRLVAGFRVAQVDPLIRRVLFTMATFSFFSLTFIGLMSVVAAHNLGMRPRSLAYGLLYAGFGLGAALGAVSIGTFLVGRSKPRIVRVGLSAFAVLLAAFAVERVPELAYPTVIVLGYAYFAAVTSLSTVLQEHLDDRVRGRVMALWIMAFGGMVPLGTLAAGPVATHTSITLVMLVGAGVAAVLAWYCDLTAVGVPA